jgi:LmbE family N-acetylglucosaminyl deacetylase
LSKSKVLVVAAHPDDEVLGMGGTLLRHKAAGDSVSILFMSDGVTGRDFTYDKLARAQEIQSRKEMALEAGKLFGANDVSFLDLPNLRMDRESILELTKHIEHKISVELPNIVYTHFGNDTNIDHCVTHRACVIALRPVPGCNVSALRFFEINSSTEYAVPNSGDSFVPNLFVNITDFIQQKLELLKCYEQEMREYPHPRSYKAINARDIYRGSSIGIQYAEAFVEARHVIF